MVKIGVSDLSGKYVLGFCCVLVYCELVCSVKPLELIHFIIQLRLRLLNALRGFAKNFRNRGKRICLRNGTRNIGKQMNELFGNKSPGIYVQIRETRGSSKIRRSARQRH